MGAWQEIVNFTFTANETSRTFTGFGTITKDDFIKVVTSIITPAVNPTFAFYPNANTTNTNYHRQSLSGFGSSVSAARSNTNFINSINTGGSHSGISIAYIKISENNKYNHFTNMFGNITDPLGSNVNFTYVTQTGGTDTTSITSLTLTSSVANGIGTGSYIQIYKLAAQKVADITVGTNSTQVDIPFPTGTFSPAIDKDSEYLLVSDILGGVGSTQVRLFINDSTTASNYFEQTLQGNGSTAQAARGNTPGYAFATNGNRNVGYAHIKLSNIGAYTYQSYNNFETTSNVRVLHYFGSSTAENITSITKLNIIGNSNSIAAGSRFTLYKLYE